MRQSTIGPAVWTARPLGSDTRPSACSVAAIGGTVSAIGYGLPAEAEEGASAMRSRARRSELALERRPAGAAGAASRESWSRAGNVGDGIKVWGGHAGPVGRRVVRTSSRRSARAPERTGRLFPARSWPANSDPGSDRSVRQTPIEVACGPVLLQSLRGNGGLDNEATTSRDRGTRRVTKPIRGGGALRLKTW
jgi:hypothetical protein